MNIKIHYVMPMAGRGSRFKDQGFDFPKPLIKIYGRPIFYWATQSIRKFVELISLDYVVLQEHIDQYNIDEVIVRYFPEAKIHVLQEITEGAVISCMKGIVDIESDCPIVFNDCDHLFKSQKFNSFCRKEFDGNIQGILLTFLSNNPKFSFVAKNNQGNVTRTAEKEVISNEAICGCYYFRNKKIFMDVAEEYLTKCNYSEYFMSGVYNIMLAKKMAVKSIQTDFHVSFGVPEEYENAIKDKNYKELIE